MTYVDSCPAYDTHGTEAPRPIGTPFERWKDRTGGWTDGDTSTVGTAAADYRLRDLDDTVGSLAVAAEEADTAHADLENGRR